MRFSTRLLAVASLLLSLSVLPVVAEEDRGLYVGAKRGTTNVNASLGATFRQSLRGDEDTSALLVGYRYGRFWAIEGAYHDLGSIEVEYSECPGGGSLALCVDPIVPARARADFEAYSLSLIPQLPLGIRFTAYGKIGLASSDVRVRPDPGNPPSPFGDSSQQDFLYGLGARMKLFVGLRLFAEWESLGGDFETTSFGLLFQF